VLLATLVALCLARAAHAIEVDLEPPYASDARVWTGVLLDQVLSTRVEESLARGMPARLTVHAERWRKRGGWFDHLESSFDAALKIRYDVWNRLYLIEGRGLPALSEPSLDSVRAVLARPIEVPVGRLETLAADHRYYIVVTVTLQPLSVEDIEEGEGWLSGEVENKRHSGIGVVTAIPRSVFDAVRNLAGFGDQRARAISEVFTLGTLASR
jgi:hypothetical protein